MSFLSLLAQLKLDASGFETGLKRAQSQARSIGNEIVSDLKGKFGTVFGAAAVEEAFRRTAEFAHQMRDLHLRTGISTDDLQVFDFAAKRAGSSIDVMVKAIENLAIAQAKAMGPGGANTFLALQRLGLSAEQIANTGEAAKNFIVISQYVQHAAVDGQLLADGTEVFKKSWRELIPSMKDGLGESAKRLREIHGVMDSSQIDRYAESVNRLKEAWFSVRNVLAQTGSIAVDVAKTPYKLGTYWGEVLRYGKPLADERWTLRNENGPYVDRMHRNAVMSALGNIPPPAGGDSEETKQSRLNELARARNRYEEEALRLQLARSDQAEKEAILRAKIAELQDKANAAGLEFLKSGGHDKELEAKALEAGSEVIAKQIELQNILNHPGRSSTSRSFSAGPFDSLARIGGFSQNADLGSAIRSPLERIAQATQQTAVNTMNREP